MTTNDYKKLAKSYEAVIFDPLTNTYIHLNFGTGDNLDSEDIEQGLDDYVNIYTGEFELMTQDDIFKGIREVFGDEGGAFLEDCDGYSCESVRLSGGMMMFKQKDYYKKGEYDCFKKKLLNDVFDYLDMGKKHIDNLELVWCANH